MKIHSIQLEILDLPSIHLLTQEKLTYDSDLDEGDSLGSEFILRPLIIQQDSGEFGDVLVEWSSDTQSTQIC